MSDPDSLNSAEITRAVLAAHHTRVLLVDDQKIIGEAVRRMLLGEPDIEFHFCDKPTEAIATANKVKPTVILQDLVMPEIDGSTLVRFYRANPETRETPIIVLSTKEEPKIKAEAFANGANDYLVKLPDRLELVARIRYHSMGYIHLLERNDAFAALEDSLRRLQEEQEKSERLLLNVLPRPIADRLKAGESTIADIFQDVTVLFGDICGFTEFSARASPKELVDMLNRVFSSFDQLTEKYEVEKIKTIGDAYLAVAGLPTPRADHADAMARVAVEMQKEVLQFRREHKVDLEMRIGIHTGPVVAGVIGKNKFIYDLWGDTVNTASRMESHGIPGRIHVSQAFFDRLQDRFPFECRGEIMVKGKGMMQTYFLLPEA
jgi:class 3 adenylate cyclase